MGSPTTVRALNSATEVTQPNADVLFHGQSASAVTDAPIGKAGLLWLVGRLPSFTVAAAGNLTITQDHLAGLVVLNGGSATITMNGTTRGAQFFVNIWNRTGAAWTPPTITGATKHFGVNEGSHTKIADGGVGTLTLVDVGGTLYCLITGDTSA